MEFKLYYIIMLIFGVCTVEFYGLTILYCYIFDKSPNF